MWHSRIYVSTKFRQFLLHYSKVARQNPMGSDDYEIPCKRDIQTDRQIDEWMGAFRDAVKGTVAYLTR